jgi:transposase
MRFYPNHHRFYCGIALHARTMDVCLLRHDGARLVHRHRPAAPDPFLQAVPPSREGLVVAVACRFPWYGLADLCAAHTLPFVLGHALSLPALHGGKATNDKSAAHKIAALLRGGMRPQASGSPAALRATRALLRCRTHLRRNRAALLAPGPNTHAPDTLPAIGKKIAYQAHRAGGAARLNDPAVPKTIAVDLARSTEDDAWLRAFELSRVKTAQQHEAQTLSGLQTVPGLGNILRLVLLDASHDSGRVPRVQDCAAYARLGTCSTDSAGKR